MKNVKSIFLLATMLSLAIAAPPATTFAPQKGGIVVTSPADSGPGTLRQTLEDVQSGDTITFDPAVFPPAAPVTISITSELPHIHESNLSIDASNAGVILDGSGIGTTPEMVLLDDVSLTLDSGPEEVVNGSYTAGEVHWRPWEDRPGATWGINTSDPHSAPNAYEISAVASAGYSALVYDTAETSDPMSEIDPLTQNATTLHTSLRRMHLAVENA